MSYHFVTDSRYRACRNRKNLSDRLKDMFISPFGSLRWIMESVPDHSLMRVYIIEDMITVRIYNVPYGAILSPAGMLRPIAEVYRKPITDAVVCSIRRNMRLYEKDRSVCHFYVTRGIGINESRKELRDLEYVELPDIPIAEDVLLEWNMPLEVIQDFSVQAHLR